MSQSLINLTTDDNGMIMAAGMNTTANITELCSAAKLVSERYELKIMYILECLLGLMAIFPNLTTLVLLWRVKIFHANLRLVLGNLTTNLTIASITITVKAFQRLARIANEAASADPTCESSPPMLLKSCMWREYLIVIPLHNALISLVILNLERLYATFRYRTYDYVGSCPFLGMFLLAGAWALSLGMNLPGYFFVRNDAMVPICELAIIAPSGTLTVITTMVSFESFAALCTLFVFVYNRYILGRMTINRARYDLSARFQVAQNEQLNKALLPGMILHMICHLPTYIFLILLFTRGNQLELSTKTWLLHLTYIWRLLYAMIDPILLVTLNASLRQGLMRTALGKFLMSFARCFGHRTKPRTQDLATKSINVMNAHFDYLQQSWAATKAPPLPGSC